MFRFHTDGSDVEKLARHGDVIFLRRGKTVEAGRSDESVTRGGKKRYSDAKLLDRSMCFYPASDNSSKSCRGSSCIKS